MKVVERNVELLSNQSYEEVLRVVERGIRICYRSEDKIKDGSAENMIRAMIKCGHCYNADTEVLTDNGFVKFKDYKGEQKVAVVNTDGTFKGFEHPLNIFAYNYSGKVYDYSSTLGYVTTAGHKMFGAIRYKQDFDKTNFRLFKNDAVEYITDVAHTRTNGERQFFVPTACVEPEGLDPLGELIGFWIGDGCIGGGNRLVFHLKKTRKIEYLTNLANKLSIPIDYMPNNHYVLRKDGIGNEFTAKYTYNKIKYLPHVSDPVMIKSIIVGLFNADGCNSKGRKRIDTTSVYIRDWLVSHAILAGYTMYIAYTAMYDNKRKDISRVSITSSNNRMIVNDSRKKDSFVKIRDVVDYPVGCVEVSTGLIIVRGKNKIPTLCGNCGTLEHASVSFLVTCDRATSHQLERSRTLSYNEMSQRYCNFSKDKFDGEVKFIKPCGLADGYNTDIWQEANEIAEGAYFNLIASNCKPEVARSVLPNSTATEVVVTGNMRNIRYFLSLRLDEHAQADIREIAHKMLNILHEKYPVFVEDLWEKYGN